VLAVLSTVTVIHRISYTYQRTKVMGPVRVAVPVPIREARLAVELKTDTREVSESRPESRADAKDLRSAPQA
jgi:hypothetical protein